jgi:hypothetical protein
MAWRMTVCPTFKGTQSTDFPQKHNFFGHSIHISFNESMDKNAILFTLLKLKKCLPLSKHLKANVLFLRYLCLPSPCIFSFHLNGL